MNTQKHVEALEAKTAVEPQSNAQQEVPAEELDLEPESESQPEEEPEDSLYDLPLTQPEPVDPDDPFGSLF